MAVLDRRESGEPGSARPPVWRDYPLADTGEPGCITLKISSALPDRELLVALPPGYDASDSRYPVIYMHDGQNLFDPATSFAGDWGLVETLNLAAADGLEPIVVGIPNRGRRRRYEYTPFRELLQGGGGGDRYLAFLVETVKPLVDRSFRTRLQRSDTVIAGASLGGLISLYALYRHAGIFGAASVQSPALWFGRRQLFRLVEREPAPTDSRVYLDCGSEEGEETLENARAMRELLLGAGYVAGATLRYREEAGAGHHERAWGRRFREALPFLLGSREPGAGSR